MATASITHIFTNATLAQSAQVNTNFGDIVDFANNEVVHRDGGVAMTGALALGSNKITGLAAADANGDLVRFEQHTPITVVDAKGDLIVASADDTPARLAAGTDGHILTADAAQATGAKYAELSTPGIVPIIDWVTVDQVWNQGPLGFETTELSLAVGANTRWHIVMHLWWSSIASPGQILIRMRDIPAGVTGRMVPNWHTTSLPNFNNVNVTSPWQTQSGTSSAPANFLHMVYDLIVGANAGTLGWEIQNPSGNTNQFTLFKGSHLRAFKISG